MVDFVVDRNDVMAGGVTQNARIAAAVTDDRVVFVLRKRHAAVEAVREAFAAPGRGEVNQQRGIFRRAEAGGVLRVEERASREAEVILSLRGEGDRQLLPVQQVVADGVPPVDVAPLRCLRVVLKVHVIPAAQHDEPVRVVEPAPACREMKLRTRRNLLHRSLPCDFCCSAVKL